MSVVSVVSGVSVVSAVSVAVFGSREESHGLDMLGDSRGGCYRIPKTKKGTNALRKGSEVYASGITFAIETELPFPALAAP